MDNIIEILNRIQKIVPTELEQNVNALRKYFVDQSTEKKVSETVVLDQFEDLKTLLESSEWPYAVNPIYICNVEKESDKQERAEGIIDYVLQKPLQDKKFLDFGCGEGHIAKESSQRGTSISIGYDIATTDTSAQPWEELTNGCLLTKDWDKVVANAPYDIVLIYDVLDHMSTADVSTSLSNLKSLLAEDGLIFIRFHPWCGRHGGHLYNQLNKAFIHLVFTDEELEKLNIKKEKIEPIIHPISTYNTIINTAGYKIHSRLLSQDEPEAFFKSNPLVSKRIKLNWRNSPDKQSREYPKFQLSLSFIDYTIKLK